MVWKVFLVVMALGMGAALVRAESYADKTGPRETATLEARWHDAKRDRDVPVMICFPKDIEKKTEKLPVIVFSHGLGGMPAAYEAYGKHWASYGYVVVLPQHAGSDREAVQGKGGFTAEQSMLSFLARTGDVGFVLDQVESLNGGKLEGKEYAPLKAKLDTTKIGMSGHSFGAITTQAMVGQVYEFPIKGTSFADKRIVAGVAMSPYPPLRKGEDLDVAFGSIKVPVLYLTGTNDTVAAKAEDRRVPFDHSKAPGTIFLNFQGGTHSTFTPIQSTGEKKDFQKLIREVSTAYWDAHLKGDEKAKQWLQKDLVKEVGAKAKVETK